MKRRTFILTAAAAAASAIAFPVTAYRRKSLHCYDPMLIPDVLARFCDENTICRIGNQYLLHSPSEAKKERLKKLILTDDFGARLQSADSSEINEWINRKISHDFAAKHIVVLDGWILSNTEARQCAFYSLVNK